MTHWLKAKEAADYARVSLTSIREAVQAGDLPAYVVGKSGREYRLKADEVDRWLESRTWEPTRTSA